MPTLSVAPVDVLVHEFKIMYNIGKTTSPPLAIASALCHGYLAYHFQASEPAVDRMVSPFLLYASAATCVLSIVPFTLLYIDPAVNNKLLRLGGQVENGSRPKELELEEAWLRQSLVRWRKLNFMRSAAVICGALFAAAATLI